MSQYFTVWMDVDDVQHWDIPDGSLKVSQEAASPLISSFHQRVSVCVRWAGGLERQRLCDQERVLQSNQLCL